MTDYKNVVFDRMAQGTFGGNNFYFVENNVGDLDRYLVCVGWALTAPHRTVIIKNDEQLAFFAYERYVMPKEAFEKCGVEITLRSGDCDFSGLPKENCFHCEYGLNLDEFVGGTKASLPLRFPPPAGQLYRAEWVDASHLFLTLESDAPPLIPLVLAIRWDGDNISEFFYSFQDKVVEAVDKDEHILIVTLRDGSTTQVQIGEWVIRDSQGNLIAQGKQFDGAKFTTLRDGITYKCTWVTAEFTPKKAVILTPVD